MTPNNAPVANLRDVLAVMPLVAILRGVRPEEAVDIAEALLEAGVVCLEIPLNSPQPLDSIARVSAAMGGRMLIGAGTVLTTTEASDVAAAGGRFMVSPNTNPPVIAHAAAIGLETAPGFFTPSEAFAALAAGATALKLFPAEATSPAYLKALGAVLPRSAPVLVVGGANPTNAGDWLRAGAAGFGVGSAFFKPGWTAQQCHAAAREFVAALRPD